MADLPPGWGDRHNQMSERDLALGGMAATKFGGTARNAYDSGSGSAGGEGGYKNSEQVRDFYLNEFQRGEKGNSSLSSTVDGGGSASEPEKDAGVPAFWAERQRERELQARQMGAFSKSHPPTNNPLANDDRGGKGKGGSDPPPSSAEVALVQVATHALERMTGALGGKDGAKIPVAERAAFAKDVKGAMDALARQA